MNIEATIPPLENGDRLDRIEFERRYNAMPENVKAELIDGVVYMASPSRYGQHCRQSSHLIWFLADYMVSTPGTATADNCTVRFGSKNEPQPDVLLRFAQQAGGGSLIDEEGYLIGRPELVAEAAASSVSYDLGPKMKTYRRHGVQEYIVWRVLDGEIDWFVLRNRKYKRLEPIDDGVIKSEVFPGLWLNVPAMLKDDLAAVKQTLQQGLASEEHQRFVAELALRMGKIGE